MATINKPRVVKDYDKLPLEVQGQIKLNYPQGFAGNLITYINAKQRKYLVRNMSRLLTNLGIDPKLPTFVPLIISCTRFKK